MDRARIVIKSGGKLSQTAEGNPVKPCQSKVLEKGLGQAFRWSAWVDSTLPPVLVWKDVWFWRNFNSRYKLLSNDSHPKIDPKKRSGNYLHRDPSTSGPHSNSDQFGQPEELFSKI